MLTFTLRRGAQIRFVVKQLAPVCRVVSRFRIAGTAGLNRVRFPRPGSRLTLGAGTYRISGRTETGRLVEQVVLVVFDRPPSAAELQEARSANVCAAAATSPTSGTAAASEQLERALSPAGRPSANGPILRPGSFPGAGMLGSAAEAARAIQPILVALLCLSIVLLGIASLPRLAFVDRKTNHALARHRAEIAALGAAAFIAVLITFLIH